MRKNKSTNSKASSRNRKKSAPHIGVQNFSKIDTSLHGARMLIFEDPTSAEIIIQEVQIAKILR